MPNLRSPLLFEFFAWPGIGCFPPYPGRRPSPVCRSWRRAVEAVSEVGNKSTPATLMTVAASPLSQGRRIGEVWVLLLAHRTYSF
ncbi:MAG: hypothetical protein WA118_11130 [Carboxydocellales bacterium]